MMVRIRKSTSAFWFLMGFLSISVFAEPSKFSVFIELVNKENRSAAGTVDGREVVDPIGQQHRHAATARVDNAVKLQ